MANPFGRVSVWSDDPNDALARLEEDLATRTAARIGPPVVMEAIAAAPPTRTAYLAEQRVLYLESPNPMPRIHLFRRSPRRA